MFACPKCHAGSASLRLMGASPAKMTIRKVFLRCTSCKSAFTLRGNGMQFNESILRVANNPRGGSQ